MVSATGVLLTAWTARVAVGCYLLRLLVDVGYAEQQRRERWSRWIWTAGCLSFLVHVACAFHFYHGWSHRAAWEHTARRTWELTGIAWGGGLLFNEAMAILWVADAVAWWVPRGRRIRSRRWFQTALHVVFAFMMANATVVFGPPFWKWIVPVAITIIALAALPGRFRNRPHRSAE